MKHRYIAAIAILLMLPFASVAGVLKGKVTDDKGEPLPFATIFVQGTTMGTTTNADAEYRLQLPPDTYWVVCQYMGFTQSTFNVTINGNEEVSHDFSLKEQTLEMSAVTIKANAEDPAYDIMRKVIKRRAFHLEQVKAFQSNIYLKGVFRNRMMPKKITGLMKEKDAAQMKAEMGLDTAGKGILYLVEQDADYYAQGGKEKTIIHSVRESGNPGSNGLSRMPPVASFYENNVNPMRGAAPRGFISPVSDNAISYYKFQYEGEFRENGYTIDKIKVTPRRLYEPLFTGTIYIVEDDWAIHSLNLMATKTSNLETLDTLQVEQTFLPLRKDTWVIKNQVIYPTINIMGFNVAGYFITVYDKQKVNEPLPDNFFDGTVVSQYDKDANKKDTTIFNARPVPLQADESNDYVVKDSLREKYESPEYIDSMRRVGNKFKVGDIFVRGLHYNSRKYKNTFNTNAIMAVHNPLVSFNTVEGLVVAPKIWWSSEIDSYRAINTTVAARYGFSNERFNAIARTAYRQESKTWIGRWWETGIEGGRYVHQFNPNSTLTPLYNTVSTLLYGRNYMKLYERWTAGAFFEKNYGNGFRWNVKASYQDRTQLNNTTSFSWSDKAAERLTSNVPAFSQPVGLGANKAFITSLGISFKPGYTYTQYPDYKRANGSRWPTFTLNYDKGIPDILNSVSDFDKWRFGIEDVLRLKLLGELSYNIAVGGFLNSNTLYAEDMMHLSDNNVVVAAPYVKSFQVMPYYSFSNTDDLYGELHVEYSLKGLLTNKIPLLRQAQWYLVLGNNTYYANDNKYYTESFIGADNLGYKWMRFLRVDVVQSWNGMNPALNTTAIRIGLKPGGMVRFNTTRNDKTDW